EGVMGRVYGDSIREEVSDVSGRFMSPTLQQAMETLQRTGSVRLSGAPADWSKTLLVLFRILMGLVILLAGGGLVGVISVSIVADNPPWIGMIFGYITSLRLIPGLFFLIRSGIRRQEKIRDSERQPVRLEQRRFTLRCICPFRSVGCAAAAK